MKALLKTVKLKDSQMMGAATVLHAIALKLKVTMFFQNTGNSYKLCWAAWDTHAAYIYVTYNMVVSVNLTDRQVSYDLLPCHRT